MSGASAFSRVLSMRDRKRNTSKTRLDINNLFLIEEKPKKLSKEEEKKVQDISLTLTQLGVPDVPQQRIEYALRSRSAHGDVKEALRLLMLYDDSVAGVLRPFDPNIRMLGAENREKTTCFLDSLLFAMFAKSDVFEAILFNNFDDEPRKKLVAIMRLWVNLLRTGRLVTVDIIQKLQDSLAECGWLDAARIRQQDASEAFAFITDKLQMPLLTLKTDIYHAGGADKDDHKFITERMLDVAIPDNVPQGETVTLEMCLEEYFNNRVEVKRHLQKRTTIPTQPEHPGMGSRTSSMDKGGATFVETAEVDANDDISTPLEPTTSRLQRPLHMRQRAPSIFSERKVTVIDGEEPSSEEANNTTRARAASVRKEVLMPAWQFLNLIPWYADDTAPDNDVQVKQHFSSKRPMLGICLKRYNVNNHGYSYRLGTHVDIPLEMATPHFAEGEQSESDSNNMANVKLSLQSVVCHRGHSVEAGHYISFVRAGNVGAAYGLRNTSNGDRHDGSNDIWLRFDDLAPDRVIPVDIVRALKEESPYLLFYRVKPLEEEQPEHEELPPYANGLDSLDIVDQKLQHFSSGGNSLASPEAIDWTSRRGSVEGSPDDTRGRISINDARRTSLQVGSPGSVAGASTTGSVRTLDQIVTEPVTPFDERRTDPLSASTYSASSALSRETTGGRPTSGDGNNAPNEKRLSMAMSRFTSRFSQKINNPDIVIDEAEDDSPPRASPPPFTALPRKSVDSTPALSHTSTKVDGIDGSQHGSTKGKDKKRKFMSKSRRGSGQKGKTPERDCTVM